MKCSVHLFYFLILCSGVRSNVQLVQSGGGMKKPGKSITLSCKTSGFQLKSYYMSWIRQAQGKGLEWIGRIDPEDGETKYAPTFTERVSLTADLTEEMLNLQINNPRAEDTGVYYCARDHSELKEVRARTKTTLEHLRGFPFRTSSFKHRQTSLKKTTVSLFKCKFTPSFT
ncbi:hypothetical protein NDU88_003800 [Pleurodeles waltl]|uniref:Ig-like domain-containing protein n=1 Tax=Pleurodeles waltl TaxID=8319 RepID=A0AAV7QAP8_PLEWA|nr:hypothetical protein NDU88_003800 [Pleurodeles waltl]